MVFNVFGLSLGEFVLWECRPPPTFSCDKEWEPCIHCVSAKFFIKINCATERIYSGSSPVELIIIIIINL